MRLPFHQVHPTVFTIIQHICSLKQQHTKYTQINTNKSTHNEMGGPIMTKPVDGMDSLKTKCLWWRHKSKLLHPQCVLSLSTHFGLDWAWIEQGLTSHSTHFRSFRRRWGDCSISQDCSRSQSPQCVRCWVVCARPLLITVVCMCVLFERHCVRM